MFEIWMPKEINNLWLGQHRQKALAVGPSGVSARAPWTSTWTSFEDCSASGNALMPMPAFVWLWVPISFLFEYHFSMIGLGCFFKSIYWLWFRWDLIDQSAKQKHTSLGWDANLSCAEADSGTTVLLGDHHHYPVQVWSQLYCPIGAS